MASTHVLEVGPTPTLQIHTIEGDLTLTGWERPELLVRGPKSSEISHLAEVGVVELHSQRHCFVQAPLQTTLAVDGAIEGHAAINLLMGSVTIQSVEGHLQVNSCGPLSIQSVDGNLSVREGHDIAHAVKDALLASAPHAITDVAVHIEPV